MVLTNLPYTRKIRRCEMVKSANAVIDCLRRGVAATAAGDTGAINVWDDRDGFYRCEAMRWRVTVNEQKYKSLRKVREWSKHWIAQIQ